MKNKFWIAQFFAVVIAVSAFAQDQMFFRVVSQQPTQIISIDPGGLLIWSNSVPGAACQIEYRTSVDAPWTNGLPTSQIIPIGSISRTRVPLSTNLQIYIVQFQPFTTDLQIFNLFESNQLVWQPTVAELGKEALFCVPRGQSISAISQSPIVQSVQPYFPYTFFTRH